MRKLFIRKPIGGHLDDVADSHQLRRHLQLRHLVGIGIGSIIGAGIFVITGQAAALYAGPAIVLSFIFAAVVCLFTGFCYAELSSFIPVSGGAYSYAYVALGEFPAFIVGWMVSAQYLIVCATVSVGWSGYLISTLRDVGVVLLSTLSSSPLHYTMGEGWSLSGTWCNVPAMLLALGLGGVISLGIRAVSRFNILFVVLKLAAVVAFVGAGLFFIHVDNWHPFIPENTGVFGSFGWSGVLRGTSLVFFAYLGFDALATLAQETIHPQRDLPRGILLSLGVCTLAYIATSLVLTGVVHYTTLNVPDPIAVALEALGGGFFWIKILIQLAILIGLASVVLIMMLGQTRVFFAMSKDGLISSRFGKVDGRSGTPRFGTMVTTLCVMAVAGFFPLNILNEFVSMAALFLFSIVCVGVLILRWTHPEYRRPFKVPFVPWIPLAGAAACVTQMAFLSPVTWVQLVGWLVLGLFVYFGYGLRNSKIQQKR